MMNHELANSRALRAKLKKYWTKWAQANLDATDLLNEYIRDLLPGVMQSVENGKAEPHTALALCVGLSWEPLLQAICKSKPDFVLLILNSQYRSLKPYAPKPRGSAEHCVVQPSKMLADFKTIIQTLQTNSWLGNNFKADHIHHQIITEATPVNVFRALHRGLSELRAHADWPTEHASVMVDVTGARKSMITGAYLYAAYSAISISYVDLNETTFDEDTGRFYDDAAQINQFQNPYVAFGLREWELCRKQFERRNYRAVGETLQHIRTAMVALATDRAPLFEPKDIGALKLLARVVRCYEHWGAGNFYDAWRYACGLEKILPGFRAPLAVYALQPWPHAHEAKRLREKHRRLEVGEAHQVSILRDRARLTIYAEDELDKINHLATSYEDYRSALLRAAGLSELLYKARWAAVWDKFQHHCQQDVLEVTGSGAATQPATIFKALLELGANDLFEGLSKTRSVRIRKPETRLQFGSQIPQMEEFWRHLGMDPLELLQLRNKTTHVCLHVSYTLAKQAVELAKANLTEYLKNWAILIAQPVPAYTLDDLRPFEWSVLCNLCGLTFLPDHLRQDKEGESDVALSARRGSGSDSARCFSRHSLA